MGEKKKKDSFGKFFKETTGVDIGDEGAEEAEETEEEAEEEEKPEE